MSKAQNASKKWRSKLQLNYRNFEEWERYSELYGLSKRLGFASAREAWDANPTIQGSTNPADFSVVTPPKPKNSKRILSVTVKTMFDDSPDTSWLGEYSNRPEGEFSIDRACDTFLGDIDSGQKWLDRVEARLAEEWNERLGDDNPEHTDRDSWALALDAASDTVRELLREEPFECYWHNREYRYFNPGTVEPYDEKATWIPAELTGEARKEYWREAMRSNAKQDYERMESLNKGHWYFVGVRAEAEYKAVYMTEGRGGRDYYGNPQTVTSGGLWGIESDSDRAYFEEVKREQLAELRSELKALGFSSRAISAAFKNVQEKGE